MGCDIHSRAEIRIDGKWQMLGDVFPETSRIRWFVPDKEYLEGMTDYALLEAIDFYVKSRKKDDDDGKVRNDCNSLPEIPRGSDLEGKILKFAQSVEADLEWAREDGRRAISTNEDGSYDKDGWVRFRRESCRKAAEANPLTAEERDAVINAILNWRCYTREEWDGVRYLEARGKYDENPENRLTLTEQKTEEDDIDWWHNEPLDNRNYSLFAVLAGVRNYDDGVTPIHPPKGEGDWTKKPVGDGEGYEWVLSGDAKLAPEDASEEIKAFQRDYMGVDGHSHSWLSLRELIDYDFEDDIEYEGIISVSQYEKMKAAGWPENMYAGPESWCRGISDGNSSTGKTVTFTPGAYEKWLRVGRPIINNKLPGGRGFGLVEGIQVTEDLVPDENHEDVHVIDLWTEVYDWSDEEIADAEKRAEHDDWLAEDRYVYNGIKPMIYGTWKEKRANVMGQEFKNMIRIFKELVETENITEDDIRVVFHFDN